VNEFILVTVARQQNMSKSCGSSSLFNIDVLGCHENFYKLVHLHDELCYL